ncbi:MAG: lysophospholipase [Lachnospiraceae bacterium]|nr:lysophospholipase [Lachnospiraceae bacterium]
MKQTYYTHTSGSDGLPLSVLRMEPDNVSDIKGIVQLVHGMNEYKERYLPFIEYLSGHGYITVIHDHRGHGKSVRSQDDLGFFYEGGFKALVKDIHEITVEIKKYAEKLTGRSDLPMILAGHSMGSMAVRCYLRKYDFEIDKLLVIGCPSELPGAKPGLFVIRVFKAIFGERRRSRFIAKLVMGGYEKRFQSESLLHSWVNSDAEEVKKYNADPLCNYLFTLNGFENLVLLTMLTYTDKGYALKNPSLPIRFYSGADDPCAVSEEAFNAAIDHLKQYGYTDVSGKLYENMRHEILNEPEHTIVFEELLDFIDS